MLCSWPMLTWVTLSKKAVQNNLSVLRSCISSNVLLCPSVKANAYGHGLLPMTTLFAQYGADWLSVNSIEEALAVRKNGVNLPLYIMGYVERRALPEVVRHGFRVVAYAKKTIAELSRIAQSMKKKAYIHVKIETGTHRQGIFERDALPFFSFASRQPGIFLEGIATHFANIEEMRPTPTIQPYAKKQLNRLLRVLYAARENGISISLCHCANTAATLLFPETHQTMVRPGIGSFGMYPSPSVQAVSLQKKQKPLLPVLTWKTRIAQVKHIPPGSSIGYGCTYKTKHKTVIAVLPVGYYDGVDRKIGNRGSVLISGKRAHIVGRACMNMIMVDVSHIPSARPEMEVVLIGQQGRDRISAEEFALWCDTINYEITTRVNERIPRIVVA